MALLTQSSSQIHEESKAAISLAAKNRKDAKRIKALATMFMVFLPASLMAVRTPIKVTVVLVAVLTSRRRYSTPTLCRVSKMLFMVNILFWPGNFGFIL